MALDLRVVIAATDKFTGPARAMERGLRGAQKAAADTRAEFQALSSAADSIGRAGTKMMLAGGAILGGLGLGAAGAARAGEELLTVSKRTGVAVESLSALKYAAEQNETSFEAVGTSLRFLMRNAGEFAKGVASSKVRDTFEELGISVTDAEGRMKTGEALFLEVANGIKSAGSEADRTRIAMALLGRGGQAALPLLKMGAEGVAEAMQEARDMGITWSEEQAEAADAWGDALAKLKATGAGAVRGMVIPLMEASKPLIDVIAGVVRWFNHLSPSIKKVVSYTIGAGGLALVLGGAALKLTALGVQTWIAIRASQAYIAALRAETAAATTAAGANARLGVARAGAAAGAGAGAGIGLGTAVGAGVGIGLGILGVVEATRVANSRRKLEDAKARAEREKTNEAEQEKVREALKGIQRHRMGLEWANSKEAVAAMEAGLRNKLVALQRAARLEAAAADPAAVAEENRLTTLGALAEAYEKWAEDLELTSAMERAGMASGEDLYGTRAEMIENMRRQWALMTEEERKTEEGRKLQLGAWALQAEQINFVEDRRTQTLEKQTKEIARQKDLLNDQLGLMDAQASAREAYADALEASGRGLEALQIRRNLPAFRERVGAQQLAGAQRLMGLGDQLGGYQMLTSGYQAIAGARRGAQEFTRQQVDMRLTIDGNPEMLRSLLASPGGAQHIDRALRESLQRQAYAR